MDEEKKKTIMIALIIGCLVAAAGIFMATRPDTSATKGPIQMLCEECGAAYKMGREEFKKQLLETGLVSPMRVEPIPLVCTECEENTAFYAKKCRECKELFTEDTSSGDFRDRCPHCGFSALEKRLKK